MGSMDAAMSQLQLYLFFRMFPWIPFFLIVAGIVVVVLLVKRKKTPKVPPNPPVQSAPRESPAYRLKPEAISISPASLHVPVEYSRTLVCTCGELKGKQFRFKRSVTLGRDENSCQIVFPRDTKGISRVHCKVRLQDGKATVIDMGSRYGTFLDGERIQANQPVRIHRGQTIALGGKSNVFVLKD